MTNIEIAAREHRFEILLGGLLRIGVTVAACTVLAGAIWFLARHAGDTPDYRLFRADPANSATVRGVLQGIFAGRSRSLIQVGLLILLATPIARVIFSLFAFVRERDYVYVALTTVVLLVLIFSVIS